MSEPGLCPVCGRKMGHMNDERLGTCPRAAQISFSGKHDSLCFLIGYERLTRALSAERTARRVMREALEGLAHAYGPYGNFALEGSAAWDKARAALAAEPGEGAAAGGVEAAPLCIGWPTNCQYAAPLRALLEGK